MADFQCLFEHGFLRLFVGLLRMEMSTKFHVDKVSWIQGLNFYNNIIDEIKHSHEFLWHFEPHWTKIVNFLCVFWVAHWDFCGSIHGVNVQTTFHVNWHRAVNFFEWQPKRNQTISRLSMTKWLLLNKIVDLLCVFGPGFFRLFCESAHVYQISCY